MPDCEVMRKLKAIESEFRSQIKVATQDEVIVVYGESANVSMRVQQRHFDHCAECQREPVTP
jgi:hypothetical protein